MLVSNPECMPEVAGVDLIGHTIALCGIFFDDSPHISCCHGTWSYPPKAVSYFHSLAHGRKLIGKVREMLPEPSWQVVEASKVEGRSTRFFLHWEGVPVKGWLAAARARIIFRSFFACKQKFLTKAQRFVCYLWIFTTQQLIKMLSSERSWSRREWRGHNSYHQKKKLKYF